MTTNQAAVYFSIRAEMLQSVQQNYRNKPEFIANQHKCICGEDDLQAHLYSCTAYSFCKDGLDLDLPIDIVTFFQRIIRQREEEEKGKGK